MSGPVYAVAPPAADDRFVARRWSGPRLVALPGAGARFTPDTLPAEGIAPAAIGDRDHMPDKTKTKPITRTKAERARILAELKINGGTLTAAEAAAAHGVTAQTIYAWTNKLKRSGKRRAKKRSGGSAAAPAPTVTNGHATTARSDEAGKPSIELRGLREWVNQAVADELRRRFGG
jgi:transposase